ncbi:MAG: AAA family ATPase, partial [Syntrophobacteraceae bacterium]
MNSKPEGAGARACWFVGAASGGTGDQTGRFVENGIWEIQNPTDRETALVKSMQPGDRIGIKSTTVRKDDLPFDNRGQKVSVMAIKAIGTVKENLEDGCALKVAWEKPFQLPREWFFFTYIDKVWRILPGNWATDALIGFAFEGKSQDINLFRNHPFWRERFGDRAVDESRFNWTRFYEAAADKLLAFRNRRTELISGIHAIASSVDGLANLQDRFADDSSGPLKDICPFTAMGIFNRGITDVNRKAIASGLANLLGVSEPVPSSFEGIPILNNQRSWFFGFAKDRENSDIDALWEVFAQGIAFAESDDTNELSAFVAAYDDAARRNGVGGNLTMGLYWIRPWSFPTLDSQSQRYIEKKLNIQIGKSGPKGRCSANDYLAVLDALEARFQEDAYPVHSFPELSLAAWHFDYGGTSAPPDPTDSDPQGSDAQDDDSDAVDAAGVTTTPIEPYSIDDILTDGCFIAQEKLVKILNQLNTKKNMILQGPPGTGKTWLAKRLAFALIGQ